MNAYVIILQCSNPCLYAIHAAASTRTRTHEYRVLCSRSTNVLITEFAFLFFRIAVDSGVYQDLPTSCTQSNRTYARTRARCRVHARDFIKCIGERVDEICQSSSMSRHRYSLCTKMQVVLGADDLLFFCLK